MLSSPGSRRPRSGATASSSPGEKRDQGPGSWTVRKWGGPFAFNIPGGFNGWFRTATGVGVDADGNVCAADFFNHRIQKFTADGDFLVAFGEYGTAPGQFDGPTDVVVDEEGTVYVVDFGNNRIQVFRRRDVRS